jgi:hypothetical protein
VETLSSQNDPSWDTNGKWNPILVYSSGKPTLMQVLGGTHEDFRMDGTVARFRVVLPRRGRTGPELSAYIHSLFVIDRFAWWWFEIDEATVSVSFRLTEIKNWRIRIAPIEASGLDTGGQ